MRTCPVTPVYSILFTIERLKNGYYSLTQVHLHEELTRPSCQKETTLPLDLGELLDVIESTTAVLLSDQLSFKFETDDVGRPY